jgi:hypothetical protein
MEGDWRIWIFRVDVVEVSDQELFNCDMSSMLTTLTGDRMVVRIESIPLGFRYIGCFVDESKNEPTDDFVKRCIILALEGSTIKIKQKLYEAMTLTRIPVTPESFRLAFQKP